MIAGAFARIVLGHLTADYLLQSKNMALHKTDRTNEGDLYCFVHCLIYTITVATFLWTFNPFVLALIFLSHYPIDRFSLATFWLRLIRGRDLLAEYMSDEPYREIRIPFACFVYAVADNTMHLVLLWWITKLL